MPELTVGFSTHKKRNIFSSLIKAVDHTDYSHVFIGYSPFADDKSAIAVFHAAKTMLHFRDWESFDKENDIKHMFSLVVTDEDIRSINRFCLKNSGIKYGLLGVFGVSLVKLLSGIGIKAHNPFADKSKTFWCSELVYNILKTISLSDLIEDRNPEDESVKWLYDLLNKLHPTHNSIIKLF